MGARGNSGVILSQFFKGIAEALDGKADFGTEELATALSSARELSYRAVGEPVEGTILTVISSVADGARRSADAGDNLQAAFEVICAAAEETVALTPTMLPVLREAGVVDAGGHGLSVILSGMRNRINGEGPETAEIEPPEPIGVEAHAGTVSRKFLEDTEEHLYGYCTQFLIEGRHMDVEAVRAKINSMAQSTVVVGEETMLNVHVHADDPGPIVSFAVSLGTLSNVKIENMDEQHHEYSVARRKEVAPTPVVSGPVSIVAVAWGEGLETVFADLGAAGVLPGGDTMNPSINEILAVVDDVPSDNVIFLPNNKNIVPAARQAAEMSSKKLSVVPSTTIPQGIAAILAYNHEADLERNLTEMEGVLPSVRTGEVCRAVRPVELQGVSVEDGQIIGMLERKLVAAGDEPTEVLVSLLKEAGLFEGALVTLYSGEPLSDDEAAEALRRVGADFPGVEAELVAGGQPHYHYIISVE